jgi:hypothetical protein
MRSLTREKEDIPRKKTKREKVACEPNNSEKLFKKKKKKSL